MASTLSATSVAYILPDPAHPVNTTVFWTRILARHPWGDRIAYLLSVVRSRLEVDVDQKSSGVHLNHPYMLSPEAGHPEYDIDIAQCPSDVIARLVNIFLERFGGGGYFFINPLRFRQSALLPFPFGDKRRPSPALLSAVYLWGSILSEIRPCEPYTPESLLLCTLQHIPQDLTATTVYKELVFETLQAEVLLSLYYLYAARPIEGRLHCAAAATIVFDA
ncbi:hypothetical protein DFH07DRAFT_973293 [Mycena maculata]|uniref:Uncharacterized protein n=1 Tax=Mycena maculata TaxID=230809 RepID=A0AAD7HDZ4_9AGAR|nr:hypothetical protein DFH07DRAFT_973293 [Mycena maculata]